MNILEIKLSKSELVESTFKEQSIIKMKAKYIFREFSTFFVLFFSVLLALFGLDYLREFLKNNYSFVAGSDAFLFVFIYGTSIGLLFLTFKILISVVLKTLNYPYLVVLNAKETENLKNFLKTKLPKTIYTSCLEDIHLLAQGKKTNSEISLLEVEHYLKLNLKEEDVSSILLTLKKQQENAKDFVFNINNIYKIIHFHIEKAKRVSVFEEK